MTTVSVDFLQQITLLDPMNRKQIISELKKVLTKPLLISDYKKIWKALYYSMWHSDKYQNQQMLSTEISQLSRMFYSNFNGYLQFARAMFHVFQNEWEKIDYWRINKFMLLFREIIEEQIKICKHFNWKTVSQLNTLYADTILNVSEHQTVQGATLHFIQIFVQCINKHMNDNTITFQQMYQQFLPFLEILKVSANKTLRDKVIQYIYEYIQEKQSDQSYLPAFDQQKYATQVFKLASQETMNPQNRKSLYKVAELFNFVEQIEEIEEQIPVEEPPKKKKKKIIEQENSINQTNNGEVKQVQEQQKEFQQQQIQSNKNGINKQQKELKEIIEEQEIIDNDSSKKSKKEEKAILKKKKQQQQQQQQQNNQNDTQLVEDDDDTIEGEDYSEIKKNPEKLQKLKDIMNSVPAYLFMSPAEKRKYFKSINVRFQETLQKEQGTRCTHNKQVHFDLNQNKVKTFKQSDNVLRISK